MTAERGSQNPRATKELTGKGKMLEVPGIGEIPWKPGYTSTDYAKLFNLPPQRASMEIGNAKIIRD